MYDDTFQIFTLSQIDSLRRGGKILRECLEHCKILVKPGVKTVDIDRAAEEFVCSRGGKPAFKGYHGFPATLCISINDEIVHGIPGQRVIENGDIVSLDGGVVYDDLYTDACITVAAGKIPKETDEFLAVGADTLERVVSGVVRAGVKVGDISSFIQQSLECHGYKPIRALTGHGLGTTLHQFPDVPNWGKAGRGPVLPASTIIAIEPIAAMGSPEVVTNPDRWTIRTKDGSLALHFEHTVLVMDGGCEVLA